MFNQVSNVKKAVWFIGLVFLIEFVLILLPVEVGTQTFMSIPLVVTLLTMIMMKEIFSKTAWKSIGIHRLQLKAWGPAFLIPAIPIVAGYILIWSTGLGSFGLAPEYQGQEWLLFFGFVVTFVISSLTGSLGEEFGWRGYLARCLKDVTYTKALLLNGFVWGLFHLPVMVFTGIYHADVDLLTYIPMFMINVTLAGAFFTHLRYVTGSIWPAIVAHTTHNLVWNYGELFTRQADPAATYIAGDTGLVLIVFYFVLFLWIKRQKPLSGHQTLVQEKAVV